MRYELVRITHDQLRLFVNLGGWVYASAEMPSDQPSRPFYRCYASNVMRTDIYLIGAMVWDFDRLTGKQKWDIFDESQAYSKNRPVDGADKSNARILVIHEV